MSREKKIDGKFVVKTFVWMVFDVKLFEWNREDNEQIEFSALEQLENPDLHVDSVRIMKLYVKIKEAVASLNCPKRFTLKDLIKPDSERTEFFISALLNFFLYK